MTATCWCGYGLVATPEGRECAGCSCAPEDCSPWCETGLLADESSHDQLWEAS